MQNSFETKVLVVDDDPQIRQLVRVILQNKFHFEIIEAENGKIALDKMRLENPFLIILDLMMPEMDGIQVLTEIRKDLKHKTTPVLICSAVTERDKIVDVFSKGIADYIAKPFNPAIFYEKVSKYLKIYMENMIMNR